MRKVQEAQMKFGQQDISKIEIDLRSRDEIPKLLLGLQYIYSNEELREEVFKILETIIPEGTDKKNGRPGMELWKILVLGALRLICNWDYDKLREIANNHRTLREMLGHGQFDYDEEYALQTLKDNVSLLTPEALDKINQLVVKAGHKLLGKKKEEDLKGRCDTFVVETNVHYPTDINLLFDAIRKVIVLIFPICSELNISWWRQSKYNLRKIKRLFRTAQKIKRSTSKLPEKKTRRHKLLIQAHQAYIEIVEEFLERVMASIKEIREAVDTKEDKLKKIEEYTQDAQRQIEQIKRRVIEGESIPHDEKIFSIFEKHTEWICKGKAGISQELGLRVCIVEDNYGFIINHQVLQKQTDDKIAVSIIEETQAKFPQFNSCSFDKGFYSPSNKEKLGKLLDNLIMPKKGRSSLKDKEIEHSEEFIEGRHQHSAVESAINGLENHGLDRCPDHGLSGFERYVAIAVLARNIQIMGNIIQQKECKRFKRIEKLKRTKEKKKYRLAA